MNTSDEPNRTTSPVASPVRPGHRHVVCQGECIESLACVSGHSWETIWNHPENRALVDARGNPNILLPGDVVFVPECRVKHVDVQTGRQHRFVVKGILSTVKLQLLDEDGQPYGSCECTVAVDGVPRPGTCQTDSEGSLSLKVRAVARNVTLTVTRGGVQETFELKLGHLDPYDTISGLQQRLNNLGFACGDPTGEMNEGTKLAMRSFMAKRRPDETTDGQEQVQSFIRDEYGY